MDIRTYYDQNKICKNCNEIDNPAFRYVESKVGGKIMFQNNTTNTIVFILSGEALVSCDKFVNVPFKAGEIIIFPMSSNCVWETITEATGIVLETKGELNPCDSKLIKYYADQLLNADQQIGKMPIKPRLLEFLHSMKNYIEDGIKCPHMHDAKEKELSAIFKAYYSTEELSRFFLPTIIETQEFKHFIMQNYLKMKGVSEFVNLSGLTISTFNRKFKAYFGMTPYRWMTMQKSKHILHELTNSDKKIVEIMRDFHFQNASHFNYYCRSVLGATPSELRSQSRNNRL